MIYVIYAGLVFLILRFCVTLFNFLSKPILPRGHAGINVPVSVLIPARNEEGNLQALLQSLSTSHYTQLQVIVLDDGSTDATYAIAEAFSKQDARFSVLKGKPLPNGWLGKNYACHQLAQAATGRYFLFLDADVQVHPMLIDSMLHRMRIFKTDLLSLFARQKTVTLGEKLVVPLVHYILLTLLPLRLIRLVKEPGVAAANGACMLFRANDYRSQQYHSHCRASVVEDMEIMKHAKAQGRQCEGLMGNGMVQCRMYRNYTQALNGFSKNILAAFGYNGYAFAAYVFMLLVTPVLLVYMHAWGLLLWAVALLVFMKAMVSHLSGTSVLQNIVLMPLQMLALVHLCIQAILKRVTNNNVWKGRQV